MKSSSLHPSPTTPGTAGLGQRFLGLDLGAETIKAVEIVRTADGWQWTRRQLVEHHKEPGPQLRTLLREWDLAGLAGAAASGRLSRQLHLPQVPTKQAQTLGHRFLRGDEPATIISLGSHGLSVLELRADGLDVFRENSRCSQGTGNFLRQLVERFSLNLDEADRLCAPVTQPAVLSGRCPVILKTDMTHLANKGEDRTRILAGLFDAVCENTLSLIKPGLCPPRVILIGGVARAARVQATFRQRLADQGLTLVSLDNDDALYVEALGSALAAAAQPHPVPPLAEWWRPAPPTRLERVPPLADWLSQIRRLPAPPLGRVDNPPPAVLLGFDIGSTGAKAVALALPARELVWEGYRATNGDPVGAAQALLQDFLRGRAGRCPVHGYGVTGSGREIVGSLLTACHGPQAVFILNEIAAHAEGASFFDARVDTIFEIGGQDAKYIRLAEGRVVDCAMNEACSAGTGSFIEEQGRKFAGIRDVAQLGREALAAPTGVSLGQHCSVFMAEVIDEAVAAGVAQPAIVAGLYDSIIQNYLNRVKGSRAVGQVIFCQGMPFASDALAAAVARQTGAEVIVPPKPGTVGALGIALLAARELACADQPAVESARFLAARVTTKDTFHCKATTGCGGAGNRCRIDRLGTVVDGQKRAFTWGGGCALYDKATRKRKLPDRAPDPFREREETLRDLLAPLAMPRGRRRVALTDEFALKGLLPFFATYLHALGFDLELQRDGDRADLHRGIQGANVPFCAPMQLYHGVAARMAKTSAEFLFLPLVRSLPRVGAEPHAVTCPIVQASADLVAGDLAAVRARTVLSPTIDLGAGGFDSAEFLASCQQLADTLGVTDDGTWRAAHRTACTAQTQFDRRCRELGGRALAFCAEHGIIPVVVLGRPYTIHNPILNSNVPAILREQGAIGIPLDCYPVPDDTPVLADMYWGQGQRILRAAHHLRRTPDHYGVYCSNYACGPDSFNLHFFAHLMTGKPFAIIETDGHSGDAGTKTRIEAFLHCVAQDRRAHAPAALPPADFQQLQPGTVHLRELPQRHERLLIPYMGDGSAVLAAGLRGLGLEAESLPPPDLAALRSGRRHTSGKECLPMALTLGSLLTRLETAAPDEKFVYLMSGTCGPCRFGVYNLLNQIVLRRLGCQDRVRIWSPCDTGYFADLPPGFALLALSGLMAADLLLAALHDTLATETRPGAANAIHRRALADLLDLMSRRAPDTRNLPAALWQVACGRLFGIRDLLTRAATEFAAVRGAADVPTVMVVGEIYVRSVPFANDDIVAQLQRRGLRVRLAPVHEWLEYCDHLYRRTTTPWQLGAHLRSALQDRIHHVTCAAVDAVLGGPPRPATGELLAAARPYLRDDLHGEAVLTLGAPLVAWRQGHIHGALSVGPHECMPNKIAEAQFFHLAEKEGLPSLTVPLNGEPLDPALLDTFAFDIHARFRASQSAADRQPTPRRATLGLAG
ncbi:MAG: CoA activase [Opitutae bacterium]|nr:CoA activase [Opitutae bacterium]